MRKIILCAILILVMCTASGCGTSGTEERIKTGEERALELKQDAEDAVDKANEDTMKLNETADAIEEELEE